MPNVTLSIPESLHKKMKQHPEMRWSEVVRQSLSQKVRDLEVLEHLAKKSKLTSEDVRILAQKINKEVFKELNR